MRSKIKLSKKAKLDKTNKICKLYSSGEHTIASCCEAAGVKFDTFKEWIQPGLTEKDIAIGNYRRGFIKEAHELYLKAHTSNKTNYKELLKDKTRSGILMRLTGTKCVETTTTAKTDNDGSAKVVNIKRTEKIIPPDTTALIFVARCLGIFPNDSLTVQNNPTIVNPFRLLTDKQLQEKRIELEQALNSNSYYD